MIQSASETDLKADKGLNNYIYRTATGVIDHETCTDNFLYRPKLVNNSFCGCELFTLTYAL